jgi:hypothetical protein
MTDPASMADSALDGHYPSSPGLALLSATPREPTGHHLRRLTHAVGQGGTLVVPYAADNLRARLDTRGEAPGLDQVRRDKDSFGPSALLAADRFAEGC